MQGDAGPAGRQKVCHASADEGDDVQSSAKRLQMKQEVAERWRERLSLTREVLVQAPGQLKPVDDRFFSLLEKVARIRGDCKVLLAAGHQTADLVRRFLWRIFHFSNFYTLPSCSPGHAISKTVS